MLRSTKSTLVVRLRISCGNLLKALCLFTPTQSSHTRFELLLKPDGVWLRSAGPSLMEGGDRPVQIPLYHLLGFIQMVQLALGESWRPRVIELPFAYHREIDQSPILGAENVLFDSEYAAIEIPAALLSTPMPYHLAPHAPCIDGTNAQAISNVASDFSGSLREAMLSCLSGEQCRIENIAALCGLPVRTLQRRLADQGVSYTQLLEETRRVKATTLIHQTDLPLTEVAFLLGYSDYPELSRAFQRWFQHTPKQFRMTEQQVTAA